MVSNDSKDCFVRLDHELEKKGVDSVLAIGSSTSDNPELFYLAGCNLPRGGIFVKKVGQAPILIVSNIDLGNASEGKIREVKTYSDYNYDQLLRSDLKNAYNNLISRVFSDIGVNGPIVIYGTNKASTILKISSKLKKSGYKTYVESSPTALELTMMIKSKEEIDAIRKVGSDTCKVMDKTISFLSKCKRDNKKILFKDKPLTVSHVKKIIRTFLAQKNLINIGEIIFALSPQSADPHYAGVDLEILRESQLIVFDVFPRGSNGYCFDVTRTFSFGKPPTKVKKMYDAVNEVHSKVMDFIDCEHSPSKTMNFACDLFEKRGFPMLKSKNVSEGFIHSLGHGVGLTIGERPYLSLHSDDEFQEGQVFTIEPGLYFKKYGGIRIEDTVAMINGKPKSLTQIEKKMTF